jgi:hypothetical protein
MLAGEGSLNFQRQRFSQRKNGRRLRHAGGEKPAWKEQALRASRHALSGHRGRAFSLGEENQHDTVLDPESVRPSVSSPIVQSLSEHSETENCTR